jgi:UDP-2,3-diacylglucosamine pyrophosphatase LpxH
MIVVISDIHLGYDKSDREQFDKFIDSELSQLSKADHLVILGDLLDFWRRKNAVAVIKNETILDKICKLTKKTNVYYLIGNHDYSILDFHNQFESFYPFKVSKSLRLLHENKNKFYFIHGYELEVLTQFTFLTIGDYERICENLCQRTDNFFGGIMSSLYNDLRIGLHIGEEGLNAIHFITKPPEKRKGFETVEDLAMAQTPRRIFLGMEEDEYLIFGHTHRPFLAGNNKVINSGSWVKDSTIYDTYVVIDKDEIMLKQWNNSQIKDISAFKM